jgi:SAM-dependent methyltransferase
MFRTPTDDPSLNESYYENEYAQGFTTDAPSDCELARLATSNFGGTEKDYSYYISILKQLGLNVGAKVFDYGCSWGYGSYQLAKAGFEITSFEIAPSRRRYAREKLDVRTVDNMDEIAYELCGQFDCFFCAHVIEHVPSPLRTFDHALRLLKLRGIFVSFTPNGSQECKAVYPSWNRLWGEVHPNFIDALFLDKSFRRSPRSMGSSPVQRAFISNDVRLRRLNNIDQSELFFAARKVGPYWS